MAALFLWDAPGRTVPAEPLSRRMRDTLRLPVTWQASAPNAIAFGGWLSDRFGPVRVLGGVFGVVTISAAVQAFTPGLMPLARPRS